MSGAMLGEEHVWLPFKLAEIELSLGFVDKEGRESEAFSVNLSQQGYRQTRGGTQVCS